MKFWLVRADAPSVRVRDKQEIAIRSSRTPKIRAGDVVVVFNKTAFVKYAKVEGAEIVPEDALAFRGVPDFEDLQQPVADEPSEKRWFRFLTSEWSLIQDSRVEDLQFSLTFIRNVYRPWLYLRRGYRSLREPDFETIVGADVFLSRTAFFELLVALPADTRLEFEILQLRAHSPGQSFESQLRQLQAFIEQRVLSVGRTLLGLQYSLSELDARDQNGERVRHVFSGEVVPDDASEPAESLQHALALRQPDVVEDDIAQQAELFRPLLHPVDRTDDVPVVFDDLLRDLLEAVAAPTQRAVEARLQRAFEAEA